MKKCETTKLFYDTYLYKLTIINPIAVIFREKNLPKARVTLDQYQTQFEGTGEIVNVIGQRRGLISHATLSQAQILYNEFFKQKQSNYKLRVEGYSLQVYSNDLYWIERLVKKIDNVTEYWKPCDSTSIHLLEPNVIISDVPIDYEYKVTVGTDIDTSFADWAQNNPGKVKAGHKFLNRLRNNGYVSGMYFYARDIKILQFVSLIIGGTIRRIDKIVYKPNDDK